MSYAASHYAQAFVEAYQAAPQDGDKLMKNLLEMLIKRNDRRKFPSIVRLIEKMLTTAQSGSSIVITSARPLSSEIKTTLTALNTTQDDVAFEIDPSLVAGIKIVKDGEHELDYSLARSLSRLFV